MQRANGECRRDGQIRKLARLTDFANERLDGFSVWCGLTQVNVLHRPARVFGLQVVL